jgi:hypothetical protein
MREVRNSGHPNENRLPPDTGSGYIWRLYSTVRMEERDGGVLLEIEAIALSRDIPPALRWLVDPIVRNVSRDSLEKSLTETSDAVRAHAKLCARAAHPPVAAGQIIESGSCPLHADNSGFRDQKLSIHASR